MLADEESSEVPRAAGNRTRDNSVPVTSKFNGSKAIETRERLYNRGINKFDELETRDHINGKLLNDHNETAQFSNPHKPAFFGRVNKQGQKNRLMS